MPSPGTTFVGLYEIGRIFLDQYYLLANGETLWKFVAALGTCTDVALFAFLYFVHVFTHPYVAALFARLYSGATGDPCAKVDDCYCQEEQNLSSLFVVAAMVLFTYVRGRRRVLKATGIGIAMVYFMLGPFIDGSCSLGGAAFALAVGAVLGTLKVFAYSATLAPLAEAALLRTKRGEKEP